jgi:putative cell wall-binding protein
LLCLALVACHGLYSSTNDADNANTNPNQNPTQGDGGTLESTPEGEEGGVAIDPTNGGGADGGADARSTCQETRLAGPDRYSTAALVSAARFPAGATAAVVAVGDGARSDAIVGAPLAHKVGGPLLLSAVATLPQATHDELVRLGVTTVYIVGGTSAVSAAVETQIQQARSAGITTMRISGASRDDTVQQVAGVIGSPQKFAVIMDGEETSGFIDAAAAAQLASALSAPILFAKTSPLPTQTSTALTNLGITKVYVIGGTNGVDASAFNALSAYAPERIAGADNDATTVAVANVLATKGLNVQHAYITADSTADVDANGIPGTPLDPLSAAASGEPVFITPDTSISTAALTFLTSHAKSANVIGGVGNVSAAVEAQVCDALP